MTDRRTPMEQLRHLRDDFSDEIPAQVLHSNSPNNAFKVRRGWFAGLTATLENMLVDGCFYGETLEQVRRFISQCTSEEFRARVLTNETDIVEANRVITLIVGEPVFNSQSGDIQS